MVHDAPAATRVGAATGAGSSATAGRAWAPRHEWPVAFALSALLVWVAQYHHFRDFGLYEDDYWFISQALGKDLPWLGGRLLTAFTGLPQGRPFGFFLPDLLSFVGGKLGGLATIYLLGFLVVTLNTWLCYRLLRLRTPVAPAIVGAAVFCLFPADTTKILLTHAFQLQPALTFALLAALAYTRGPRPLAYVLAAGALLTYENGYLALFGLPLFAAPWSRATWRALLVNALALLLVFGLVVALRFVAGEGRATSSAGNVQELLWPLLGSLVLGPARSLAALLYGPLKAVPGWDVETVLLVIGTALGAGALLWWTGRHVGTGQRRAALEITGAGAVMLVAAYGLAFTHFPPNAIVGRGTSVHLGATIGMAVVAAGVAWLLFTIRWQIAAIASAIYLAFAAGYYVTIERDFMRSWQVQRGFWQDVAACCGDLQDGTVLLYELTPADEQTTFIFTNSWADPLVLSQTYAFPPTWQTPPRLFSLTEWQNRLEVDDAGRLRWWVPGASWDEHWEPWPQGNVVVLRRGSDGRLQRVTGTIETPAGAVELKPPAPAGTWPPAQLAQPLLT